MLGSRKATAEMAVAFAALASLSSGQVAADVTDIPYDAAVPVFAALRDDLLPELLRSKSP